MKKIFISILLLIVVASTAQLTTPKYNFTHRDSLQGGFSKERMCFDVQRYDLNITINPEKKSIIGYNDISFKIIENTSKIGV